MTTNQARKPSERFLGVKLLIIAASLVGMLGGWAILAVDQVRAMLTTQPAPLSATSAPAPSFVPTPALPNQPSVTQPQTPLRSVQGTGRPNARTRSSR